MSNNTTVLSGPHLRRYERWYAYIFAGLYLVVMVVALLGNLLVSCAIALSKKLRRNATNLFILSLALSDLITAALAMPFDVDILITDWKWIHGESVCKAWAVAYLITVPTSIITLLALSVDRYKTLSDPLNRYRRSRFMTRKRALITIVIIWAYCMVVAILPVAGVIKTLPFIYMEQCFFPLPPLYSTLSSFINFVLPLLSTCALYVKIYQIARLHPQQQQKIASFARPKKHKDYMHNMQAAKTISLFVCAFFFCWVPYCTLSIISNLCDSCYYAIPPHLYPPFLMLGYLNSALNPFLFSFRNRAFQSTFWRLCNAIRREKSANYTSRSLNSFGRRSELPDADGSTMIRMFSMRSLSGSRSESTPDTNHNDTNHNDTIHNDTNHNDTNHNETPVAHANNAAAISTSSSREPLTSDYDKKHRDRPLGLDQTIEDYKEINTHL